MCLNLGMKGKHLRSETTIQWDKTKTIDTIYHFILCTSKLKLKKVHRVGLFYHNQSFTIHQHAASSLAEGRKTRAKRGLTIKAQPNLDTWFMTAYGVCALYLWMTMECTFLDFITNSNTRAHHRSSRAMQAGQHLTPYKQALYNLDPMIRLKGFKKNSCF
jgi:hypothetical protein